MDDWTEKLESGGQIDVIYTDLEKAFDRVPHNKLLSKLVSYGIHKDIIQWIAAFLKQRRQHVKLNGFFSFWTAVFSGVPQGSILGPLLFIIFINDIMEFCTSSEIFLYADDSKIYKHIITSSDKVLLQNDIVAVKNWLDKWTVTLNIDKCKTISYGYYSVTENKY